MSKRKFYAYIYIYYIYNSLSIYQLSEIDIIVSVIVIFLESRNYHVSKFTCVVKNIKLYAN